MVAILFIWETVAFSSSRPSLCVPGHNSPSGPRCGDENGHLVVQTIMWRVVAVRVDGWPYKRALRTYLELDA